MLIVDPAWRALVSDLPAFPRHETTPPHIRGPGAAGNAPAPAAARLAAAVERWAEVGAGLVCVVAGLALGAGLLATRASAPESARDVGTWLVTDVYLVVSFLFVLTGLNYVLGPRRWLRRLVSSSLHRLAVALALVAFSTLAAWLFLWAVRG